MIGAVPGIAGGVQRTDADTDRLIQDNMRLVTAVARRFSGRGVEWEDLLQIGTIGLIKAAKRFDPTLGFQFSTYAVPLIAGEIRQTLRDGGMVRVSRGLKNTGNKLRFLQAEMTQATGSEPTLGQVAQAAGVSVEEALLALDAQRPVLSLDTPPSDEDPRTLVDRIADPADQTRELLDRMAISQGLKKLDPIQQKIILLRYFRNRTQTEIARSLGISQVQVSRLERRALEAMRKTIQT